MPIEEGHVNPFNDEPIITTIIDGKVVPNGPLTDLVMNESPQNGRKLRTLGLFTVAGLATLLGLKFYEGFGLVSANEPDQQPVALTQPESPISTPTPTKTPPPPPDPQYYRVQNPWLDHEYGEESIVTNTPPPGRYLDPDYQPDPTITPTPTQHLVPKNYYREGENPGFWAPVGEYPTPTFTIEPGTYLDPNTNPDLTYTPEPTQTNVTGE